MRPRVRLRAHARGQGARLLRIHLSGRNKGLQQTLLTTEDRPRALCAVRGGCLVASGGNIVKVSDPAPAADNAEGEVATVLLAAVQEPVTSVVADQGKLIVYFATADMTYAWIQGQIVPVFPAGSRLAWAKDTLTICRPSSPGSQMIQIPAASKHTEGLAQAARQGRSAKAVVSDDRQATTCSHCGSGNLTLGIHLGLTAEVGHRAQFKDGLLLVGTEPLLADLCSCGHVQRLYVKNPDHRWLT